MRAKIYVVGASGSGKTYLAKKLADKHKIIPTSLDYIFYKHTKEKTREELSEKEWNLKLQEVLRKKTWIIEGVNLIPDVFEKADLIIYLRKSLANTIFNQWKRYFSDPVQRREHGFVNNLKLSRYLARQHLQKEDLSKVNDVKYSRVRKLDRILNQERLRKKTRILRTRREVEKFLSELTL